MFRHLQGRLSHNRLPMRMADFGALHRNERSGALGGLTRVRRFQQDDAHIFCRPDQVKDEVVGALNFMKDVYKIFGMSFSLMRSTRPESAIGADTPEGAALWDSAEEALSVALNEFAGEGNWKDDVGGGAFYGPKIDIKVKDCMGRRHQVSVYCKQRDGSYWPMQSAMYFFYILSCSLVLLFSCSLFFFFFSFF